MVFGSKNVMHNLVLTLVLLTIIFLVISLVNIDVTKIDPSRIGSSTFAILLVNFTVVLFSYKDRMKSLYPKKEKQSFSRFFVPISLFSGIFLSYGGILLSAQDIAVGSQESFLLSTFFIGSVVMMAIASIVFFARSEE
jgi:hypothetical protein